MGSGSHSLAAFGLDSGGPNLDCLGGSPGDKFWRIVGISIVISTL